MWKIAELDSVHYGTRIEGPNGGKFTIWRVSKNTLPSIREKQRYSDEAMLEEITHDSHYETQGDYEIAMKIVELLNKENLE